MDHISHVFTIEEIVEHILKFLPMKQLQRVARVCKLWHNISKKFKESRQQIAWLLYTDPKAGTVDTQIGLHLETVASEPCTAIVFSSSNLYSKPLRVPARNCDSNEPASKFEKLTFGAYLKRSLPGACNIVGLTADGVIGTTFDMKDIIELESSKSAACLLLPQLSGVDVYTFTISNEDRFLTGEGNQLNSNRSGSAMQFDGEDSKLFSDADIDCITNIPANKEVRMIMLCLTEMDATDSEFGRSLVRRYGANNTLVAGGFADRVITELSASQNSDTVSGLGVAICGTNVHITSAVLHADISQPADIEKCLLRLRSTSPPPSNKSIALMFACMGRGHRFYNGSVGVESAVFKRLYPGVPLFGFFGSGEIGYDFPLTTGDARVKDGKSSEGAGDATDNVMPQMYHSYTTIFVLLTFTA